MTIPRRAHVLSLTIAAVVAVVGCSGGTLGSREPATPSSEPGGARTASPAPSIATRTAGPSAAPSAGPTAAGAPTPRIAATALPATGANSYDHIFLVVFENRGYGQIVGRSAAPNFNRLIRRGTLTTAYKAITHPSLPNYLALIGGSTFGIRTDCSPSTCPVRATNLGSLLSAHGRTWKAYMDSMPSSCGSRNSGSYAVRHDPFVYFNNIRTTSLCGRVVPYSQLTTDLATNATTPRFVFVTPNICHDMHDCSIATGDKWLGGFASKVMNSPAWTARRSLFIVTFDEDNGSYGNRIVTFAIGSPVRRSVAAGKRTSTAYNHYNLLRTIEYYLGVPTLGRKDSGRAVMTSVIPK